MGWGGGGEIPKRSNPLENVLSCSGVTILLLF